MVSITPINVGAAPDDGTGDTIRAGGQKINTNEANLNSGKVETDTINSFGTGTKVTTNAEGLTTDVTDAAANEINQTTFVFQPGGSAANNVYTSWAALMVDLLLVTGPKQVCFDDAFSSITIPSGTYDMTGVAFVDSIRVGFTEGIQVTLADGVIFSPHLAEVSDGLVILCNNTSTPVMTISTTGLTTRNFLLSTGAIIRGGGTEPFISLSGTGQPFFFFMDRQSAIVNLAGNEVIAKTDTTVGCTIVLTANSVIGSNTLEDIPSSTAFTLQVAVASANASTTHSGLNTAATRTFTELSQRVSFIQTTSGLTSDNVRDAIEEIVFGFGEIQTNSISTTDATITEIQLISNPSNSTTYVNAEIVGHRTGGAAGSANDGAVYEIKFRIKKDGTTPTIEDLEAEYTSEDQIGWGVSVIPSGSSVSIRVQGAVDNNINWVSRTRFSELT